MATGLLLGKRIIVTGAASGIGRAIANLFEAEGAEVAWFDRNKDGLDAAASGSRGPVLVADQTDGSAVTNAVKAAASQFGGLDAVVNAAGIADTSASEMLSLDRWNTVLSVNLTGPFLICQAALPYLRNADAPAIVNIASASGLLPSGSGAAYAASKAGLIMLSKSLAAEWGPKIRVNAICPGTVDTSMLDGLFEKDDAFFERIRKTYALQRIAKPEEIAQAALFLVSDRSSFVTGISMAVDGGRTFH